MRLNKVILRAVGSTLSAIVILLSVLVLTMSFLFPSTMMRVTYDLGMDKASIRNAKRAYALYGDNENVYFIAYATEVAIGLKDDKQIEICGEKLLADNEFAAYCARIDEQTQSDGGYAQYVCANVCLAKYEQGKNQEAIDTASAWVKSAFPQNNALAAVGLRAKTKGDQDTVTKVLAKMNEISKGELTDLDRAYLGSISRALNG